MKKILLLLIAGTSVFLGKSQTANFEKLAAMQLVQANKSLLNIPEKDLREAVVQSTYKNKLAGTTMVYLQQTYKGIAVYNQLITLAFKDSKLVSQAGGFIADIEKVANLNNGIPAISAGEAVMQAITNRKLTPTENLTVLAKKENKTEFGTLGISNENVTAELMWFPSEVGKIKVNLGWQVYIIQSTSADYWLVNVDAVNKNILSVHNLTVYCNWDDPSKSCDNIEHKNLDHSLIKNLNHNQSFNITQAEGNNKLSSPAAVNNATYRVIPYPAESPIHAGGAPTLVINPWNLSGAGNNATTLNWHSIGTTNYDITRGNNVWAQEDRNANNGSAPVQVSSTTTPDPLAFDFVPDFTVDATQTTPIPNQQFNTTNLFYWNNIIHDLTYQYGFDEAARNFQGDNLGRGGNQNDFVFADAQDGAGTNNANFSTPADGGNGRMQMYLWTGVTPNKDGDVDNGIIAHEYAHGISNRLTGNGSTCLQNAEQMGEGWSDYYSLMYTQDWATSNLNTGFTTPRGIGTYVINQSASGLGIRSQRYSTNFAINNKVYATTIPAQVHSRGEIWCAVLWDMTWGIINQVGSINPNLFNASGTGGNSIALKLVTEGLKLQPCSPGFISSRDAILQADLNLYGGAYRCTILEAFRRRGMGLGASQGSSASVTDQIPSFTNGGATIVLLQSTPTSVPEGQNIVYINRVTTDPCSGFTGYTITDTLPLNVSYVSGGTYNSTNRVVSFPVTQAAGTTVNYSFTVNINAGTYFAPVTILNEQVPATMPATWTPVTTVPTGGTLWEVSTAQSNSAPNAFFVNNDVVSTDKRLELTNGVVLPTGASAYPKLSFWHRFNTEDGWDGGVAEVSTNGGTTWTDLGANILTNPYNNTLGAGAGNNLANRAAFSGLISSFIKTTVNLSAFAGQTAQIRFRFASDDNTAGVGSPTGWFVDDVNITNTATVSMRSSFFNASMVRTNFTDTVTLILPGTPTTPPLITTQPTAVSVCAGTTATFTAAASNATSVMWEVSVNAGVTWTAVVPAATSNTLTLTAVTTAMNNNRYRLVATNAAGNTVSNGAILTVTAVSASPLVATPVIYCQNATPTALTATGSGLLWYSAPTGGAGSTTAPIPSTLTVGTFNYYVTQTTTGNCESPRVLIAVTVNPTPAAPTVTAALTYCQNTTAPALTASGTGLLWYSSPTGGTGNTTAPTPSTLVIGSIVYYVSQSTGSCEGPRAAITVNITATTPAPGVTAITYCQNATATALTASGSGLLWYTAPTGGAGNSAAPVPNTIVAGTTTYYVSQASLCGESARAALVVTITATPATPTGTVLVNYCQGGTVTALSATGTALLWYTTATGGTGSSTAPIPSTATAGSVMYYVSQTLSTCESARLAITVNVSAAPAITLQPTNITTCTTTATFNVTATGTNLTYQWQVSIDGVNYTNITGATNSTYIINGLTAAQANNKYRVIVSAAGCSSATSNAVTAKVGIIPTVVLTATPVVNFNPATNGGLYITISPSGNYTYQWKRNDIILPSLVGSTSLTKANGLLDQFGTYQVTAFDVTTGCSGVSNSITVSDIEGQRNRLFISPNPSKGVVKVSFYSNTTATQARILSLYDSKGLKMLTKSFNVSGIYGFVDLDLSNISNGVYMVILRDAAGNKIAAERVVKQ